MLFQGTSILQFSCASGAKKQHHLFKRLDTPCINATSQTILNIVKNFVRKIFQAFRKFFKCTPSPPPHSSEFRYGPEDDFLKYAQKSKFLRIAQAPMK